MKTEEKKPNFEIEKELKRSGHDLIAGVDEVGRGALAGPIVAAAVIFNIEKRFKDLDKIVDSKIIRQAMREKVEKSIRKNALSIGIGVVKVIEIDKFGIGAANILAFDRALQEIESSPTLVCHCEEFSTKQSISGSPIARLGWTCLDLIEPRRTEPRSRRKSGMTQTSDCRDQRTGLAMTEKEKLRQRVSNIDFVLIDGRNFRGFNHKYRCIEKGESKSISIAAASIIAKVYRDNLMTELHPYNSIYGFDKHKGYGSKSHIEAIKKHGPSIHHRKSFLKSILNYHSSLLQ